MPVDWNVRRARGRLFFMNIAAIILGLCVFYLGYQGVAEGSIRVVFKSGESFVAYASGPHAERFTFEVWLRMIVGGCFAAGGVLGLLLWRFSGPARRERMLFTAAAMRAHRVRVSGWVASLLIGACICFYFYASAGA